MSSNWLFLDHAKVFSCTWGFLHLEHLPRWSHVSFLDPIQVCWDSPPFLATLKQCPFMHYSLLPPFLYITCNSIRNSTEASTCLTNILLCIFSLRLSTAPEQGLVCLVPCLAIGRRTMLAYNVCPWKRDIKLWVMRGSTVCYFELMVKFGQTWSQVLNYPFERLVAVLDLPH